MNITKGETLNLLYVVDFWKMLWYRCTLNRKKNVNSRHLYLCVLRCVADRVIWDFLLSLTVTSINHNQCLVCPRWYHHVLHTVANAAPTFFIIMVCFGFFLKHTAHKKHLLIIWHTQSWVCWCYWSQRRLGICFRTATLPMNLLTYLKSRSYISKWGQWFFSLMCSFKNILHTVSPIIV